MHLLYLLFLIFDIHIARTQATPYAGNKPTWPRTVDPETQLPTSLSIVSNPHASNLGKPQTPHHLQKRTPPHVLFFHTGPVRLTHVANFFALFIYGTSPIDGPYVLAGRLSAFPMAYLPPAFPSPPSTPSHPSGSDSTMTTNYTATPPNPNYLPYAALVNILNQYINTARRIGPIERVEFAVAEVFPGGGTHVYVMAVMSVLKELLARVPILALSYHLGQAGNADAVGRRYEPGLNILRYGFWEAGGVVERVDRGE